MIEGINPVPPQNLGSYDPTAKQQEESRLKQAAKQFEQVFMQQMFTEMRKGVEKSKMFGDGKDEEMFQGMLDQERTKAWSDNGGIGIAQVIFEQMRNQMGDGKKAPEGGPKPESAPSSIPELPPG